MTTLANIIEQRTTRLAQFPNPLSFDFLDATVHELQWTLKVLSTLNQKDKAVRNEQYRCLKLLAILNDDDLTLDQLYRLLQQVNGNHSHEA